MNESINESMTILLDKKNIKIDKELLTRLCFTKIKDVLRSIDLSYDEKTNNILKIVEDVLHNKEYNLI
jgi:hypothetical protein